MDEAHTGADEYATHDQRTHNSPEEHPVLMLFRHGKVAKHHQEDKKVINAEREFDDIAGEELECGLLALPEINDGREGGSQTNPHRAPSHGLAKTHDMTSAMEDAQVQHQHRNCKQIEKD